MKDPLFGGLMLPYLKELNKNKTYQFHLITYEQEDYAFHQLEKEQLIAELHQYNLHWYPIQYHTGRFLLLKKGYDFLISFLVALKIKIKYRPTAIVGFLTIAGAFSWILSKLLRLPLAIYCFEPHSDYMIDFNIWTKSSIKYKLLHYFEKKEATDCDYLVVPTSHTLDLVNTWRTRAKKIWTVPISVDTHFFQFEAEKRAQIRQKLDITDKKVILYLGKFGGLYYELPEMAAFCKELVSENPDYFLLIISPQPKMEVELAFRQAGIAANQFRVLGRVPYEEVSGYISASDMGLVAIPPLPAQKYRTPIKVGHYLACGLPYMIAENIADDDKIAKQHQVGIVYQDLSKESAQKVRQEMQVFFNQNPEEVRVRCRQVALDYRGIEHARKILEEILELF
jgi:UDP-N-acetylglucosamine:LPS N-acetylglucosamine transferase